MATKYSSRSNPFDWVLFSVYLALVSIGLLMLYATGEDFNKEQANFWSSDVGRQFIWAGISVFTCLVVYLIDWKFWNTLAYPLFGFGIAILILLLIFGTEVKGSKSWFVFSGFSIQPSEFAKISTILALSAFCSTFKTDIKSIRDQIYGIGIFALPAGFILLQPDAGSALTYSSLSLMLYRNGLPSYYFVILFALLTTVILTIAFSPYMAVTVILTVSIFFIIDFIKFKLFSLLILIAFFLGIYISYLYDFMVWTTAIYAIVVLAMIQFNTGRFVRRRQIAILGIISVVTMSSFLVSHTFDNVLKPHQQDRINVWLKPSQSDPRGSLYNIMQSKMAIGSGGLSGKGFLEGTMTKLNYVPEQKTDFIFTTIGEEQGFVGCLGVITLFFLLLFKILSNGERSKNAFPLYFSYGVAGLIFLHVFINIGMTIGVSPVIGIPLPFISKGGSSLLSFSIIIGILLNMSKQIK